MCSFVVLDLVSFYFLRNKLSDAAGENVSKMTYFVSKVGY